MGRDRPLGQILDVIGVLFFDEGSAHKENIGANVRVCHAFRSIFRASRTARPVMPAHSRSKNGVASLAYVAGIHAFTGSRNMLQEATCLLVAC
jgi:hypothetical protein